MNHVFDQVRSQEVARMIERAMVSAFRADPADVIGLLDACRSSLMLESHDEVERVEIARRIVEAKISILYDRQSAREEFLSAWVESENLGYSSLEREASMLVYLVKFLERSGASKAPCKQSALNRLETLVVQLAASGNGGLAAHFKAVYVKLSQSES